MANSDNKSLIEAIIFASDFPVTAKKICEVVDDVEEEEAEELIRELQTEYETAQRGFKLMEIAGGFEFVTRSEYAIWVKKLFADKRRTRLSRAGLETVAIVAYRQPVTRSDIERIRGVESGGPLRTLLERNLIKISGREKSPGRPLIYRTTDEFLRYFGINDLSDLPHIEEIEDIIQKDEEKTEVTLEQLSLSGGSSSAEEV